MIQEIFACLIMYNFSMLITENLSADDDKQNAYRYKTNYSILATAQANRIDAERYLTDLFSQPAGIPYDLGLYARSV